MLFHSYAFLFLFLPLTWLGFLWLKKKQLFSTALAWLTLCSLVFYAVWNPPLVFLITTSMLVNYTLGRLFSTVSERFRFTLLLMVVVFNLGLIGYFKYANFLASIYADVAGMARPHFDIVLPLAISFFTFQQIAYGVDCYRSTERIEKNLIDYCLFVTFFPQLIAGPIIHPSEILPQFKKILTQPLRRNLLIVGVSIFAIGLFKKVVLADHLGRYFEDAYPRIIDGASLVLLEAWAVMTAAAMQIYFDYSGYADMAVGLALLFGIRLPINFYSPYKGTSPVEFWRRWNITLMRFLRDHIYIPLGGSRYGQVRKYAASMATMVLCGVWHGAGWGFIIWGFMVGVILAINNIVNSRVDLSAISPGVRLVVGRAITFACYVVPLAAFMFPGAGDGMRMILSMVGANGLLPAGDEFIQGAEMVVWIAIALVVVYTLPNCEQMFGRFKPTINLLGAATLESDRVLFRWSPSRVWAVVIGFMFAASIPFMYQVHEFFYFQF